MNPEDQQVPLLLFIKAVMKSIKSGPIIKVKDWAKYLTEALATEALITDKTADQVFLRLIDALPTAELTELSGAMRQILKFLEKNKIKPTSSDRSFTILDCLVIKIYYNHFLESETKEPLESAIALVVMSKPFLSFNGMKRFFGKHKKKIELMSDIQMDIFKSIQPTRYHWLDWGDEARRRNIGPLKLK